MTVIWHRRFAVLALTDDTSELNHPRTVDGGHARRRSPRLSWPIALYVFCITLPIGFNLGPLAITTVRMYALVVLVPLMIRLFSGHYGRVFATDILLVLHLIWGTMAMAIHHPNIVVQQMGSIALEALGGYVIARAFVRTPEDFMAMCRTLIFAIICTIPFAIFETLTGRAILSEIINAIPGLNAPPKVFYEYRLNLIRPQVIVSHPILYGLFCSIGFSLAFVALKGTTGNFRRYLMSALVATATFLSLSSGAILAVAVQLSLIGWAFIFSQMQSRWWLLVGLFVLAYVVVDILSNRTPIEVFMSYATFSPANAFWRALIFEWGMKNVMSSPWIGIGMNDWFRPDFMHTSTVDNFWLVLAMRYGLPGLALLALGFLIAILKVIFAKLDETDQQIMQLRRGWVFTMLGLCFTLSTVHVWNNVFSLVFFLLGAGMWMIKYQAEPIMDQKRSLETVNATSRHRSYIQTLPESAVTSPNPESRHSVYSRFPARHSNERRAVPTKRTS